MSSGYALERLEQRVEQSWGLEVCTGSELVQRKEWVQGVSPGLGAVVKLVLGYARIWPLVETGILARNYRPP